MGFRGEGPPVPEELLTGGQEKKTEDDPSSVPESELDIAFVRSSGPGGQNVNKTSTKAQVRWNVGRSGAFTEEQKAAIREAAGNRLTADDEILISAEAERSQPQNRDAAIGRLQALIAEALAPKKERVATQPSRAERDRRLEEKRRQAGKKQMRKMPKGEW